MKYNLKLSYDYQRASEYLTKLKDLEASIELKRIVRTRTTNQNAYLHKLFDIWGNHLGYTRCEAKIVVKTELGYIYEKNEQTFYVETSKMDWVELDKFVSKFRHWSKIVCNLYLPTPKEYKEDQIRIDNELENYF